MSTSTGELREILIDCIDKVKNGKMTGADAKAVAMLAGQITLSLQVEVNARRDDVLVGKGSLGALALGESGAQPAASASNFIDELVVDVETAVPLKRNPWPGAVTVHRMED